MTSLRASFEAAELQVAADHNQRWGSGRTATPRNLVQERADRVFTMLADWLITGHGQGVLVRHRPVSASGGACRCGWQGDSHPRHLGEQLAAAAHPSYHRGGGA